MKSQGIPPLTSPELSTNKLPFDLAALLVRCRQNPQKDFTAGGCTRAEVFRLASAICRLKAEGAVCLCSTDKALIAAALLAALHGGPQLVLPYGSSSQALREARESIPFSCLLSDTAGSGIPGSTTITTAMLAGAGTLPEKHVSSDAPILRLFTGGSTGKPKLWSKTPANLLGEAAFLISKFGFIPDDVILCTAPPQHIYGLLFSVLAPLISGCTVLAPLYSFPQEIVDAARTLQASVLVSVPVQYHVLHAANPRKHSLRMAFSSAGALHPQDAAFFHGKTGLPVTEIFGSTETGGIAWRESLGKNEPWRPFEELQWKIAKSRLLVRSAFLSPELPRNGDGFFATADRAEACDACSFTLHGRADEIVKVGGKRVDLAEVCAKVKQLEAVDDAVVFARQIRKGRGAEIAAFVAGSIDAVQLRQGLSEICEPYAMPRHIIIQEAMPLLPTGKYDREKIEGFFES